MCERKSAGGKGPEYGNTCPKIMEGLHATIRHLARCCGVLRIAKLKRGSTDFEYQHHKPRYIHCMRNPMPKT